MPSSVWDQINSPLLYALPFFVLFIAIEVAAVRYAAREDLRGYEGTPWTIYIAFSVNLVHQFFIHTENGTGRGTD
jgi:hypothetical protein